MNVPQLPPQTIPGVEFLGLVAGLAVSVLLAIILPAAILYRLGPVGRQFLGYKGRLVIAVTDGGAYEVIRVKQEGPALIPRDGKFKGYFLTPNDTAFAHPDAPTIYFCAVRSSIAANPKAALYAKSKMNKSKSDEKFSSIYMLLIKYHGERVKRELELVKQKKQRLESERDELEKQLRKFLEERGYEELLEKKEEVEDRVTLLEIEERIAEIERVKNAVEENIKKIKEQIALADQEEETLKRELERAEKAYTEGNITAYDINEYYMIAYALRSEPKDHWPEYILGETFDARDFASFLISGGTPANVLQFGRMMQAAAAEKAEKREKFWMYIIAIITIMLVGGILIKVI